MAIAGFGVGALEGRGPVAVRAVDVQGCASVATRFCPSCGDEFLASVDECPDCEVALVDERPTQLAAETMAVQRDAVLALWRAVFNAA